MTTQEIAATVSKALEAAEIDFEGMTIYERSVEFEVRGWGDVKRRRAYDVVKKAGFGVAFNGAASVVAWDESNA